MEKLYNNIILPKNFAEKPSDASHVPYLENPPEVINVSVGRQLFVDDFLIETTLLEPEYHSAKKYEGNPVFFPETPWENDGAPIACTKSGGVWYDEEQKLFKMWYQAGWLSHICYAESLDGINWTRPDLPLEKGTNKILLYNYSPNKMSGGIDYLRPDTFTIIRDSDAPKSERYKLFLKNPVDQGPGIVATSADGINFENFSFTEEVGARSTIFYNPFRKKWVYSIREWWPRSRSYRECGEFIKGARWNEKELHKWLKCDDFDKAHPYIGFEPQLYNVDCVGYESIMLGMFEIHLGPENGVCEKYGVPKITELIPMYSRDGYNFSRPSRETIVKSSMQKGSWDRGYIQSSGGVCVINKDEIWIYYGAFAGDERYRNNQTGETNGMYRNGSMGIAKLRRDGFVSMNGKGTLLTRKLEFKDKKDMFINASGSVTVEIYNEEGRFAARSETFSGDSTKEKVRFESFDIKSLNGKVFRLKFEVDGKLYSFGFADENGSFGGARAAGTVE